MKLSKTNVMRKTSLFVIYTHLMPFTLEMVCLFIATHYQLSIINNDIIMLIPNAILMNNAKKTSTFDRPQVLSKLLIFSKLYISDNCNEGRVKAIFAKIAAIYKFMLVSTAKAKGIVQIWILSMKYPI